jgi:AcrR family transcriptional regulator
MEAILAAGARVLGERGWHGTTMRDVAEAAGVGLATLYHYLGGREDLLYQAEMRILGAAEASAQAALAGRGARDRLRALLTDHIRRVLAQPVVAPVLAGRLGTVPGERGRRVEASRRRYLAVVQAAVEGVLRRPRSRGRGFAEKAAMLLGMADRLALDARAAHPSPQAGRLAGQVLAVFLEGALPRRR